jgi:hypothetical protein
LASRKFVPVSLLVLGFAPGVPEIELDLEDERLES